MEALFGILDTQANVENIGKQLTKAANTLGLAPYGSYTDNKHGLLVKRIPGKENQINSGVFVNEDKTLIIGVVGDIKGSNKAHDELQAYVTYQLNKKKEAELIGQYYKHGMLEEADSLDGTFSYAIYDLKERKITVRADQFGYFPIYYYQNEHTVLFSSNIKSILNVNSQTKSVNTEVLYEILKMGFYIPPDTLFKDIKALMPGDKMIITYNGKPSLKILKGQRPEISEHKDLTEEESSATLMKLFRESLFKCLDSYKEIGLLLSGGIDSAAIAAFLGSNDIKVKCYTVDLDSSLQTELKNAVNVIKLYNLEHHTITELKDSYIDLLPEIAWYNETVSSKSLPEYLLGRAVAPETEVVLTGDGNDLPWGIWGPFENNFLENNKLSFYELYLTLRGITPESLIKKILPEEHFLVHHLRDKVDRLYNDSGNLFNDLINTDSSIIGLAGTQNLLGKVRLSPNSQVYRSPYLTNKINDFIMGLPISLRRRHEGNRTISKYLFRQSLYSHQKLTREIISDKKSWMYSPNSEWLRKGLGNIVQKVLLDKNSPVHNYFNYETTKLLIDEHINYRRDYSFLLMVLFTFDIWHRIFIDSGQVKFPSGGIKEIYGPDIF